MSKNNYFPNFMDKNTATLPIQASSKQYYNKANMISQSLSEIQQYFGGLSHKIALFTATINTPYQSHVQGYGKYQQDDKIQSIDQLIALLTQYTHLLHTKITSVKHQFQELVFSGSICQTIQAAKNRLDNQQRQIYEIPVELQHVDILEDHQQYQKVIEYFDTISTFEQIPRLIADKIQLLFAHTPAHLFQVPVQLYVLDDDSDNGSVEKQSGYYQNLAQNLKQRIFNIEQTYSQQIGQQIKISEINNIFSGSYNISEDNSSLQPTSTKTISESLQRSLEEAITPTFQDKSLLQQLNQWSNNFLQKSKNEQQQIQDKRQQFNQKKLKGSEQLLLISSIEMQDRIPTLCNKDITQIQHKQQVVDNNTLCKNINNTYTQTNKVIYQIPIEIIQERQECSFVSQIYEVMIKNQTPQLGLFGDSAKMCDDGIKRINYFDQKQCFQKQLTFSNGHSFRPPVININEHFNTKSQDYYQTQKKQFIKVQDNKDLISENLKLFKKSSYQSFSQNQLSVYPTKKKIVQNIPPKSNMNWSASIQSFVIGGSNQPKNVLFSDNYSSKLKQLNPKKNNNKVIQQQPHEQQALSSLPRTNLIKVPIQLPESQDNQQQQFIKQNQQYNLTEHPQLNFCGSSEINQHTQYDHYCIKNQKLQHSDSNHSDSFLKYTGMRENFNSLQFKQSCIVTGKVETNQGIDPTGSVQKSLAQFDKNKSNNNRPRGGNQQKKNKKNKVYIIEAESSSEGSHSDREMYVSQMKKKQLPLNQNDKNKSLTSSSALQAHENQNSIIDKCQLSEKKQIKQTEINNMKFNTFQFSEMKQIQRNLEQQKNSYSQQLIQSESLIEKLQRQLNNKQEQLRNLQESYQQKLHIIIEQISLYECKLQSLEQELQEKTRQQNLLSENLDQNNRELIIINQKLQQKINQVMELEQYIIKLQRSVREQQSIIRTEKFLRVSSLEQLNLEFNKQKNDLLSEIDHFKLINAENLVKIDANIRQIEQKNNHIDQQKQEYEQVIRNLELNTHEINKTQMYNTQFYDFYQQELDKVSEKYEKLLQQKIIAINKLRNENQKYKKQQHQYLTKIQEYQDASIRKQQMIEQLGSKLLMQQGQHTRISNLLPQKVIQQIEFLRKQLILTTNKLDLVENQFQNYKIRSVISPNQQTNSELIRLQFEQQKQDNTALEIMKDQAQYTQNLQDIVQKYEQIILKNYYVIKQLQQRVYQYLGDAMSKQKSEQRLYKQVLASQNQMNNMVMQKISLQAENKRMKKMISASQKKISAIGTRLIHAARKNLKDYSQQTSNETYTKNQMQMMKQAFRTQKIGNNQMMRARNRDSDIGYSSINTMTK